MILFYLYLLQVQTNEMTCNITSHASQQVDMKLSGSVPRASKTFSVVH